MVDTAIFPLLGGALIGLAASLLLVSVGRVAGISGILGGALELRGDLAWRGWFLSGLVLAGLAIAVLAPSAFGAAAVSSPLLLAVAGLLVGFGTRLGNGCTSGHGVCGLARFSSRSLVATLTFMATGALAVFVVRHLAGGGS